MHKSERAHCFLVQIAKQMGVPVEAFYIDAPGEAGELLTLMRLWSAIGSQQGRRRVLMAAKLEFERFGDIEPSERLPPACK